ncbi:hypothetical protein GCM10011349_39260 [Novosphingobium indicum]|uniref:Helicase HerA-like C-terminal domain-containing protein n=1 Tax=Novosphingobium indicum TaxID=462949 RepID=A0ABQ2JXT2_9SPHN|nr:hypothetical protein GCM10011349_39260 [Novosphingobium indicum]
MLGQRVRSPERKISIVPEWRTVHNVVTSPGPFMREEERHFRLPKPPSTWPWDIRRALATLAAAGNGSLFLTAEKVERNARTLKELSQFHEELIAASYIFPEDRAVIAGLLNCKAMLENQALLRFEVAILATRESETLRSLIAMSLFGTLASNVAAASEVDLRLLAASRFAPARILPSKEEATDLLVTQPLRKAKEGKLWRIASSAEGIEVTLSDRDRARHMYVIGGTGTGKTTLLCSTILQDIRAGETVVVVDCHGDLAKMVSAGVPSERVGDVIYADAANIGGRFAIELVPSCADSSSFEIAADTLSGIFKGAMYSDTPEGFGPMWESYFRNSFALLAGASESERCLASLPRVFNDPAFRRQLIEACAIPSVKEFWTSAKRAGGEAALGCSDILGIHGCEDL